MGRPGMYINALLILLVPFVGGWNGLRWWGCTEPTLQAGQNTWIEPSPPFVGGGGHKQWCSPAPPTLENSRIPEVFRGFPWPHSLLYTVSLLFLIEKVVLCRSGLCLSFVCYVVLGSRLEQGRYLQCLGQCKRLLHWTGSLQGSQVLSWCPVFLLVPFVLGKRLLQCSWECTVAILQVGLSTQIELLPTLSKCRGI